MKLICEVRKNKNKKKKKKNNLCMPHGCKRVKYNDPLLLPLRFSFCFVFYQILFFFSFNISKLNNVYLNTFVYAFLLNMKWNQINCDYLLQISSYNLMFMFLFLFCFLRRFRKIPHKNIIINIIWRWTKYKRIIWNYYITKHQHQHQHLQPLQQLHPQHLCWWYLLQHH